MPNRWVTAVLATVLLTSGVIALAVPLSSAFAGEFLILAGVFRHGWGWSVVGAVAMVLAAAATVLTVVHLAGAGDAKGEGEVVAIERDPKSIAKARARVTEAGLQNVSVTESDVGEILTESPLMRQWAVLF